MSDYYPYCEKCLRQPTANSKEFYDYRFDKPVCISCVEEYGLEPESNSLVVVDCYRCGIQTQAESDAQVHPLCPECEAQFDQWFSNALGGGK